MLTVRTITLPKFSMVIASIVLKYHIVHMNTMTQ